MSTVDQQIGRVASRQYGVVSRHQAHECGLSDKQIRRRIGTGRWLPRHPSVFHIAGAPETTESAIVAAVLARSESWVSFEAAAHLWGRPVVEHASPAITRLHGRGAPLAGVTIHQSTLIPAHHVTTIGSIPIMTRARTVFDLAAAIDDRRLGRFLDDLLVARRLRLGQVERVFRDLATHGRAGTRRAARVLDERVGVPPSESALEDAFAVLCRRLDLPFGSRQAIAPWVDVEMARSRVDVAYPDERVIVELDGRAYHGQLDALAEDRRRDQLAVAAGWRVLRFTWFQVVHEPRHVERILRSVLLFER